MKTEHKIAIGVGAVSVALGIGYLLTRKPAPPLEPAEFTVSDLIITPAQVYPGEVVSISVLVTNISQISGQATIECEVV